VPVLVHGPLRGQPDSPAFDRFQAAFARQQAEIFLAVRRPFGSLGQANPLLVWCWGCSLREAGTQVKRQAALDGLSDKIGPLSATIRFTHGDN